MAGRPDRPGEPPGNAVRAVRLRLAVLVAVVGALWLAMALVVALDARSASEAVGNVSGPALALLVAGIAVLAIPLFPAALLAGAAGYAAGAVVGGAIALVGLSAGAVLCAGIARGVGAGHGVGALWRRAERLAEWIALRPFRSIAVARLIPGVPFHLVSYAAGLARVPLPTVGIGTAVGFGPRCFLFAALGGSLGSLDQPETRAAAAATLALLITMVALSRHPAVAARLEGRRSEL